MKESKLEKVVETAMIGFAIVLGIPLAIYEISGWTQEEAQDKKKNSLPLNWDYQKYLKTPYIK